MTLLSIHRVDNYSFSKINFRGLKEHEEAQTIKVPLHQFALESHSLTNCHFDDIAKIHQKSLTGRNLYCTYTRWTYCQLDVLTSVQIGMSIGRNVY